MVDAASPLIAFVGFKRSRLAMVGGVRSLVVRDGTARIHEKRGRVDLDVPVGSLTARLTRTRTVELRSSAGSVIVYGIPEPVKIPEELDDLAVRESGSTLVDGRHDALVVGPGPTGFTRCSPEGPSGCSAGEPRHRHGDAGTRRDCGLSHR